MVGLFRQITLSDAASVMSADGFDGAPTKKFGDGTLRTTRHTGPPLFKHPKAPLGHSVTNSTGNHQDIPAMFLDGKPGGDQGSGACGSLHDQNAQ